MARRMGKAVIDRGRRYNRAVPQGEGYIPRDTEISVAAIVLGNLSAQGALIPGQMRLQPKSRQPKPRQVAYIDPRTRSSSVLRPFTLSSNSLEAAMSIQRTLIERADTALFSLFDPARVAEWGQLVLATRQDAAEEHIPPFQHIGGSESIPPVGVITIGASVLSQATRITRPYPFYALSQPHPDTPSDLGKRISSTSIDIGTDSLEVQLHEG